MPSLQIGDIVHAPLEGDYDDSPCALAVVIETPGRLGGEEAHHAKAVFLDGGVARELVKRGTAYERNRGWFVDREDDIAASYRARLAAGITDEEHAMAMRILLTGHIPGLDD